MLSPTTKVRSAIAAGVAGSVLVIGTPVAFAATASADTEKNGTCRSANAVYDFEVDKEHGRYEVSLEVDSNVRGQDWRVRLFHDGNRYYSAVRTTDGEGEIDVERNRPNTSGKDKFRFRAKNLATGAICKAKIVRRAG